MKILNKLIENISDEFENKYAKFTLIGKTADTSRFADSHLDGVYGGSYTKDLEIENADVEFVEGELTKFDATGYYKVDPGETEDDVINAVYEIFSENESVKDWELDDIIDIVMP